MISKLCLAIAALVLSPAFVFSQDIFFLLEQGGEATSTASATTADGSGSALIYSSYGFDFDAIDIDFSNSNPRVIQFTGGALFDQTLTDGSGGTRFVDISSVSTSSSSGTLLGFGLAEITNTFGVKADLAMFDQGFDPSVGPNGAFLLGRVDFNIVGEGTTTLDFSLGRGDASVVLLPATGLTPVFGPATLTVGPAAELGDVNTDGGVDFGDVSEFIEVLSSGTYQAEADCNQDDAVDFLDVGPFVSILMGS